MTENTTSNEVSRPNMSSVERMASLNSGTGIVSTFQGDTMEERKATLTAVTNAVPIADNLDTVIRLSHVVTQAVTISDDKTGEMTDAVRVILIDADGVSYAAVSEGLMGSLRDVFGIMGHPTTWPEPLPIKVVEKRGRSGYRFMKIELA